MYVSVCECMSVCECVYVSACVGLKFNSRPVVRDD